MRKEDGLQITVSLVETNVSNAVRYYATLIIDCCVFVSAVVVHPAEYAINRSSGQNLALNGASGGLHSCCGGPDRPYYFSEHLSCHLRGWDMKILGFRVKTKGVEQKWNKNGNVHMVMDVADCVSLEADWCVEMCPAGCAGDRRQSRWGCVS
jgi:hypothetical protein